MAAESMVGPPEKLVEKQLEEKATSVRSHQAKRSCAAGCGWEDKSGACPERASLTNQCTRIATARFYKGYMLAKKWVIVVIIAGPQSRDFKR